LFEEVEEKLKDWQRSYRRATFTEIEKAVDEEMAQVRAQMLEDIALDSKSTDWRGQKKDDRPKCLVCGTAPQASGEHTRRLVAEYEQTVELSGHHGRCPECGASRFPRG